MRNIGPAFFAAAGTTVTLNPSDKDSSITLSSGNMVATKGGTDANRSVRATLARDAATDNGYWEVYTAEVTASAFITIGLAPAGLSLTSYVGSTTTSWAFYADTGQKYTNGSASAYGSSWKTNGLVIGVAMKNGKVWFAINNTWQNSGDPAAGTGEAFSGLTGSVFPTLSPYRATAPAHQLGVRFHPSVCTYAPPSGFGYWDR